jgi:anti-sigma factor RsiW
MNRHLGDDELVDRLYGLGGQESDEHLAGCDACAERWNEMRRIQARLTATEPVSGEFLAAQRRAIYARLGERVPETGWRTSVGWMKGACAPALAATALVAIGIAIHRPVAMRGTSHGVSRGTGAGAAAFHADADDAKLFSDVYSMEQSAEPSVAAPIHTLFEDNQ